MVTAVTSAFSIKDIGGRRCVPVHELEYVLARFGIAVGDAFDLQFMATAITPSALTRIEAHITSMASWPGLPATDDKHELARRLAKLASGMTAADLVQLHIDDFFTLRACGFLQRFGCFLMTRIHAPHQSAQSKARQRSELYVICAALLSGPWSREARRAWPTRVDAHAASILGLAATNRREKSRAVGEENFGVCFIGS